MIFTIVSVNTFNRNDRNLFGMRFYIVLSDSMSATDFDAGDLVVVKEVDPTTLQPGDIIAYQSQNSENYGATVTHKIRAKTTDNNGNPGFITYGTTTGVDDETVVTYPFILGKYATALPKVGTFFQFLKTPRTHFLLLQVRIEGCLLVDMAVAGKSTPMTMVTYIKDISVVVENIGV